MGDNGCGLRVLAPLYIELRCSRMALHWLKVSYISERMEQDGDSLMYVNLYVGIYVLVVLSLFSLVVVLSLSLYVCELLHLIRAT